MHPGWKAATLRKRSGKYVKKGELITAEMAATIDADVDCRWCEDHECAKRLFGSRCTAKVIRH